MDRVTRIGEHFAAHAALVQASADALGPALARAADVLTECVLADGRILACGNGGSAADAAAFAAELVGRFERDRPELPALSLASNPSLLTATRDDAAADQVFARQLRALGGKGDVLVALCTSGNASNVVAALGAAREREMRVVALTGAGGGRVGELLAAGDVHVCVPHDRVARIREIHVLALNCLCDAIDHTLLGDDE